MAIRDHRINHHNLAAREMLAFHHGHERAGPVMTEDKRWDPEMRAAFAAYEKAAAELPPMLLRAPFDPSRAINDTLNTRLAAGGPAMAESSDRWVAGYGRRILCRLHKPRPGVLPVLVYAHGGGWVWSSVDTHDRLVREYAAASGITVVSVDYALSPEAKFPRALEEVAAVVRHIAQHGAEWGLDPARIVVGGDSAGGNLALGTALMLRDTSGPSLRGILANYPVCAADFDTPGYREFGPGGYFLTEEKMRFYWQAYLPHEADRFHPWAAPLHGDCRGLPPTLVHLAELDLLTHEGLAMTERLRAAGVTVECEIFPGLIHGFLRNMATVSGARAAIAKAGAWLKRATEDL